MERTEATGFGVALVGHIALIVALKFLLDTSGALTPPPAMEVSFAEDVGLVSTAPETEASAPAFGEEPGPAEEAAGSEASVPEPEPVAEPEPVRTPSPPTPRDRPEEPRRTARSNVPSQPRPQPQQRPQAQPQRQQAQPQRQPQRQPSTRPGSGPAQTSRGSRLPSAGSFGDDAGSNTRPAAQMTGQAAADIGSAIQRQVQPCAIRQRPPAPEAREIVTSIRLHLTRDGRLASAPQVVGQAGIDEDNRRYAELVRERAILAFRECSPLRNLPQELYDVPRGWQTFTLRFRFPG